MSILEKAFLSPVEEEGETALDGVSAFLPSGLLELPRLGLFLVPLEIEMSLGPPPVATLETGRVETAEEELLQISSAF